MKIVNYGSINLDHVYQVDHIVQPGETLLALDQNLFCGGKGLNQSIALAKAGADVCHAGIVGEDGDILLDALRAARVDITHVRRAPGASAHTVIQVDKNGQNCIIVFSGENMHPSEEDIDRILADFTAGDAVLMQNELYNTPLMMRKAAEKGMTIIFNPSPVNREMLSYPLDKVSWFLLNEIEGEALTGETDPEKILDSLEQKYPGSSVVLTLGKSGAWALDRGQRFFQPAFEVKAVDTTAAGDTFTGFFLAGISGDLSIPDALRRAAFASSIAVSRKGAADSIPTAEEVSRADNTEQPLFTPPAPAFPDQ